MLLSNEQIAETIATRCKTDPRITCTWTAYEDRSELNLNQIQAKDLADSILKALASFGFGPISLSGCGTILELMIGAFPMHEHGVKPIQPVGLIYCLH